MGFRPIVKPTRKQTIKMGACKSRRNNLIEELLTALLPTIKGGFAMALLLNGHLTCHNVGQRIDEMSRTGIVVFGISNRSIITLIGADRRRLIEKHNATSTTCKSILTGFGLQKQR